MYDSHKKTLGITLYCNIESTIGLVVSVLRLLPLSAPCEVSWLCRQTTTTPPSTTTANQQFQDFVATIFLQQKHMFYFFLSKFLILYLRTVYRRKTCTYLPQYLLSAGNMDFQQCKIFRSTKLKQYFIFERRQNCIQLKKSN